MNLHFILIYKRCTGFKDDVVKTAFYWIKISEGCHTVLFSGTLFICYIVALLLTCIAKQFCLHENMYWKI